MSSEQEFSPEDSDPAAGVAPRPNAILRNELPPALRNWRVIEIDGEATPVADKPAPLDEQPITLDSAIPDHPDDVLVATLAMRQQTINAGDTATFQLSLLNYGDCTALFKVEVEGWIHEEWLMPSLPGASSRTELHALLRPGERTSLSIQITPPRTASTHAGEHPLAIVVRAPEYPGRFNRLGATLIIAPYVDFVVGQVRPQQTTVSWFKRSGRFSLPITNQGNAATTFRLQALDVRRQWRVEFGLPRARNRTPKLPASVTVQPGQKVQVPVRVQARALPLFGLQSRRVTLPIAVAPVAEAQSARLVNADFMRVPLIGPWQWAVLCSCIVIAVLSLSLVGLLGLVMWRSTRAQERSIQMQPVQTTAVLPMIALVVDVPAVRPAVMPVGDNAPAQQPSPSAATPESAVPLVRADQVTGPGTPAPVAQSAAPVDQAVAPTPATAPHKMTYQQMFQEIGRRYDLNWRMLAAQAYVESSFDSNALGQKGALGLMQIMPNTWREWSAVVKSPDPFDSYSNVLVAAVYLDYLRTTLAQHGHAQVEWMLVAYNWGIDKVLRHLDNGLGWDDLPSESRQYAQDIMRVAETIPTH